MSQPDPRRAMIDHGDPNVVALTLAAIEALPDATPVLILADRLQELQEHDRERKARRFAACVGEAPPRWQGFGPRSVEPAARGLSGDERVLTAWLAVRWLALEPHGHHFPPGPNPVHLAALAPLGLARPGHAAAALRALCPHEQPDPYAWPVVRWEVDAMNITRAASELLLDMPTDPDAGALVELYGLALRAHQRFEAWAMGYLAQDARHLLGGCVWLASGRNPVELARKARKADRRSGMAFLDWVTGW